jgi:hypothetical protein
MIMERLGEAKAGFRSLTEVIDTTTQAGHMRWIHFRVRSAYDTRSKQFITDWHFLVPNGNKLGSETRRPQVLADLMKRKSRSHRLEMRKTNYLRGKPFNIRILNEATEW